MTNRQHRVIESPTYDQIFSLFEQDLERTKASEDQGKLSEAGSSWSLEVLAVRTPPGQLVKRIYTIDTADYTLHLEETYVGPEAKRGSFKLCLLRNELLEHIID